MNKKLEEFIKKGRGSNPFPTVEEGSCKEIISIIRSIVKEKKEHTFDSHAQEMFEGPGYQQALDDILKEIE